MGFRHIVTSKPAPVASGWSIAGWASPQLESAAFARSTPCLDIQERIAGPLLRWSGLAFWLPSTDRLRNVGLAARDLKRLLIAAGEAMQPQPIRINPELSPLTPSFTLPADNICP